GKLEVYHLVDFAYQKIQLNERGHYPIAPLGVELGLWQGSYLNNPEQLWLRWWDLDGNLLLVGQEEAQLQKLRAEQQQQRAEQAERKAAQLAERLRAMGINPDDDF
ncbi:MAG: Uma2 family endonuclease, partial [Cuspidothrix sp.]